MAISMTGYGKGLYEDDTISISVEIKSVNSKFLDLSIRLPRNFSIAEEGLRSVIKSKVTRGKVDCFVNINVTSHNLDNLSFDMKLADEYYQILNQIKQRYNLETPLLPVHIASFNGVVSVNENADNQEEIIQLLLKTAEEAVEDLMISKNNEGDSLHADASEKLNDFLVNLEQVKAIAGSVPATYRERLEKRIAVLLENVETDQYKLAQEVAYFADRSCIDEELTRLESHINQFGNILSENGNGKKLDFITQEMLRETNTIASKANNLEITNLSLEMKYIIEKIREQVQNLE